MGKATAKAAEAGAWRRGEAEWAQHGRGLKDAMCKNLLRQNRTCVRYSPSTANTSTESS